MVYKHICKKGNKFLAKIEMEGKDKWFTVTQAVYNYATKNYEEGDEVDVHYTVKNGQYFATKITRPGTSKREETPEEKPEFTCSDCGRELKDGKYDKCYNCNKKNPSKATTKSTYVPKDTESIKKQAVLKASVHAIQVMTGQINDVEALGEMVLALYDRFLAKINE